MHIVLKRPLITEKSMKLADKHLYTFEVDKNATKDAIAKAVTDKFSVKVVGVKTINVKGERKSQRRVRKFYHTTGFKKAIVQVGKTQKIALFETPKEEEVTVTTAEGEPIKLKEKKDLLGRTKVRVEKGGAGAAPTTQRKVITGK
ncbi:50S ribosomal protein L23 [Candidatus Daviesbacteria bacterium]|nr:50S ribosomal protein L23 [Candidatus Daviesbacteria bacterium]